jgi:EAL domain-containing protein (putative c-di-GMP-specific phosphodiesterase class I)/GGDEF domain-containing protein
MIHKQIMNILLVSLSDSDVELLTGGFRKAGQVCREIRVTNSEQFAEQLNGQRWELIIFDAERATFDIQQCGHLLRKGGHDIPVIYMGNAESLPPPDAAVAAVFSKYEFPRLVSASLREVQALLHRRQLATLQHTLNAAEHRSHLLMTESKDPVAYITDGMIIHANPAFCQQLGFDDVDGFPIVDLVEHKDQDRLKNVLKQQLKGEDDRHIDLHFHCNDNSTALFTVYCSNTQYDDEACIQLLLNEPSSAANTGNIDESTGLANRYHFEHLLQEFVENERNSNSSLLLISVDNFSRLRQSTGLKGIEVFIADVAGRIRTQLNAQIYGRISDDIIAAVTHHIPSQTALEMAEGLLNSVEEAIIEIKTQSLQCTLSAVIMPINHLTPPHAPSLLDTSFQFLKGLIDAGGNQAAMYKKDRQQLKNSEAASEIVSEALADNRLQLLFEPMVNLSDADGDHYEVSFELKDRAEDEITAGELMRNIENEASTIQLDRWIVMEATKLLAKERLTGQDIKLVINLSANVFHDPEFCSWLGVAIKAAALPAATLTLQFGEDSIRDNLKPALDFCTQFKRMGGNIGVRNFGRTETAHKFLGHIKPGLVKPGMRRSDTPDSKQISEFIRVAKGLGSRIVVPNVGSAATLAMLWQLGPDFIQGSYVHEPQPTMSYEFSAFN